ncbi:MAG: RNA polymerase sigma factor RpoD/SigA, partial [Acidobacteria bacterium]|nr:RNA polymerase sigma factor RpoD/SigA [Acidobacteriota bacterium]
MDSGLQLYLREINQTRLLAPEEEIGLARRIRKGDLQARDEMIRCNLRLVV